MLIFLDKKLAFLATPKTGTTAVEMALRGQADIVFARARKHVTAQRYAAKVAPFLKDAFGAELETLAVMRAPIEQIRSWYRYRSGPRHKGTDKHTRKLSFDDFVLEVIRSDPPEFANIGSQFRFLSDGAGTLLVDHLFAYEKQIDFRRFLSGRMGETVKLDERNISPPAKTPLSPEVEAKLRAARADEFALYDRLMTAGGYLGPGH